jgi:AraC-like DNA-binding protein
VFDRSVSRRSLAPLTGDLFHLHMSVHRLGSTEPATGPRITIQRMTLTTGFVAERTDKLLADGNDDVVLHLHDSGRRIVRQLGREAEMQPGGALITSNGDPSRIGLPESCSFTSIGIPRKWLRPIVPRLEDSFARPLEQNGLSRLISRYVRLLDDEALAEAPARSAIALHLADLVALLAGTRPDAAEVAQVRGLSAARLRSIKADIADNFRADVSAAAIALRQGVSPRYVHKLFEAEGISLSQYVLAQRLADVRRKLADGCHAHRPISALAFDAGFGDLSTFNHAFRRHFGQTPSDVRAAVCKRGG